MNICICTSSFPLNRSEIYHRYLEDLIKLLQVNGHTVSILTQEKRGHKDQFIPGVEVTWFPWKMAQKEVLSEISMKSAGNLLLAISLVRNGYKYANRIQQKKKIGLFICLWVVPSGFYIYLKNLFFTKTPYILWALGSDVYGNKDNFLTRLLLRKIIKGSKAVFADGFELCDIVKQISGRDCEFLPTFHKVEATQPAERIANTKPTFLYIGRLSRVKGVDVLIEALKLLPDLDFKCNIIGDGEMMEALKSEVQKSNLTGKVEFLGKITDETEKARHFNQADCVIIPSRSESIPVVLSEAVQYNKPMITSNAGDMEMLVKKYSLGSSVKKEDAAALAEAIRKFAGTPIQLQPEERKALLNELLFENSSDKLIKYFISIFFQP